MSHSAAWDVHRYGPGFTELEIDVVLPQRVIGGFRLGGSYAGATDRGIRIGDSIGRVRAAHDDLVFDDPAGTATADRA